jgi:phosphopantothenoylcysteine decarboxylase/phosphopantothenate--cysteine ligase
MVDPAEIMGHMRRLLASRGALRGRRVVVSAAGTQEPIDPVRAITNRSSGKQGFALAQAALDLGAEITLIAGPTHLPTPTGARRIDVRTAQQMLEAVMDEIPSADALIMAAAVADYRPSVIAGQKIKKSGPVLTLTLETTTDILMAVARYKAEHGFPRISVGFAAESQNLLDNAAAKLSAKALDMIVANDVTASDAGFGVDTNRVSLLHAGGEVENLPLLTKDEVAQHVMDRVMKLLSRD